VCKIDLSIVSATPLRRSRGALFPIVSVVAPQPDIGARELSAATMFFITTCRAGTKFRN
jgi:hypothetical protein